MILYRSALCSLKLLKICFELIKLIYKVKEVIKIWARFQIQCVRHEPLTIRRFFEPKRPRASIHSCCSCLWWRVCLHPQTSRRRFQFSKHDSKSKCRHAIWNVWWNLQHYLCEPFQLLCAMCCITST